jgi:hypothetical protein
MLQVSNRYVTSTALWVASMAWIIGLAAVVCDRFEPAGSLLIVLMRTLFGVATCGAIGLVLISKAQELAGSELYLFTRLVSRWVYILMYALAAVRILFYLYDVSQQCNPCSGHHPWGPVRPLDDFQFYVAASVIPLWLIRAIVRMRAI